MRDDRFYARLLEEQQDLRTRISDLGLFIQKRDGLFTLLSARQQYLLQRQQEVMLQYHAILDWRIEDIAASPLTALT